MKRKIKWIQITKQQYDHSFGIYVLGGRKEASEKELISTNFTIGDSEQLLSKVYKNIKEREVLKITNYPSEGLLFYRVA